MYLINIFPLGNISMEYNQKMHMFLTHMVEKYPAYAAAAKDVPGYKILDNSLIELGGAVDLDRVIKAAEAIEADEIILPDVFCDGPATLKAVEDSIATLNKKYPNRSWPFKLQAVVQGKDENEWVHCYIGLLKNPDVDVIGVPKVLAKMHPQGRPYFVNTYCALHQKPHHLLGMWYSMTELLEYDQPEAIRSCDTVLTGFINKYNMNFWGVRPDGHTVNLETDVIKYRSLKEIRTNESLRGVECGL